MRYKIQFIFEFKRKFLNQNIRYIGYKNVLYRLALTYVAYVSRYNKDESVH